MAARAGLLQSIRIQQTKHCWSMPAFLHVSSSVTVMADRVAWQQYQRYGTHLSSLSNSSKIFRWMVSLSYMMRTFLLDRASAIL